MASKDLPMMPPPSLNSLLLFGRQTRVRSQGVSAPRTSEARRKLLLETLDQALAITEDFLSEDAKPLQEQNLAQ